MAVSCLRLDRSNRIIALGVNHAIGAELLGAALIGWSQIGVACPQRSCDTAGIAE
jgi:hypothetical protein